ncbi:MAG: substrate-binding domain-containing protein [Agriterribacter sp.]
MQLRNVPFTTTHSYYMKLTIRFAVILSITIGFLLQVSCTTAVKHKYKIGISQLGEADEWRKDMKENLYRELIFYPELEAIYKQADYNSETQVAQIRELMAQDIDLLIVCPYESQPLTPIINEVYQKGIKVVIVDRNINSDSFNSYIGADNLEVGHIAGIYAAKYLSSKGNIIEITGLQTSTPAREREKGFAEALTKYPDIHVQKVINGDWLEGSVKKQLPHFLEEMKNTQLIFAHNDVMARTAAKICSDAGLTQIKIIGVDALPGTGLNLVEDRTILASVLYPTGGSEAIRTADKLLKNENVPRKNILETIVVDSTNAIMLQQQANKISEQQKSIVKQEHILAEQSKTFKTQRNLIFILLGSLAMLLMLAGLLVFLRTKNIKANKLLLAQNEEISTQSRQIVLMADKAREASEEKLNFFTNISHELKTPLTLIITPADEGLQNTKLSATTRNQFSLIKKNATRLLLLVNQLMDFRKLELKKMKLELQEIDLVQFLNDIVNAFAGFAKQHHIDCRLITKESALPLWVDPEKIEKVFFNILSNAFKFTANDGFIHLHIKKDEETGEAIIKVQDSGTGIGKEEQDHVFEMFYQANYESNKGTGVGLALSKELVDLHGGSISVESEKEKGSIFTVCLKLGNAHFSEEQLNNARQNYNSQVSTWIENYNTLEAKKKPVLPEEETASIQPDKSTILIVEDNGDLRDFLSQRLSDEYDVVTANDGAEGIQKIFDEMPDIIVSDVMMPKKDGIELTKSLKDDIRTKHIPVILLTAKSTEENKLQGLTAKADAYITKPFNINILEGTINSLLENRSHLKEHYSAEIPASIGGGITKKTEKSFVNHLNAVIENNIANESFSVEDICRDMRISRIQLYRKVKSTLNTSVNDHILHMRIQRAKQYLQNDELSIAEIAYKTGFSTASYFSTTFKKYTNENPKAYKEKFR